MNAVTRSKFIKIIRFILFIYYLFISLFIHFLIDSFISLCLYLFIYLFLHIFLYLLIYVFNVGYRSSCLYIFIFVSRSLHVLFLYTDILFPISKLQLLSLYISYLLKYIHCLLFIIFKSIPWLL